MQKSDINILIVDDDKNLGKALSELVARLGYKPIHCTNPDEALAILKIQSIYAAVIDCMLPKMNGRDLAVLIRKETSPELPIIMMSGIYKDKMFIKDTTNASKAVAFLVKPFDLTELSSLLDLHLKNLITVEGSMVPIHELMRKREISNKERMYAINETETVHGFDLPWVYSLLLNAGVSGHLNLISADGEVAGVGFSNGQIVQVNLADAKSYFGNLLVENGFITTAELNDALKNHNKVKVSRMGEYLVDMNVLSPHAVEMVVTEQFGIRLSKTIANTSLKVNFVRSSDVRLEASVNRVEFTRFLDDWINSKLSVEWLKAFYVPWMHSSLARGPEYSEVHRTASLPLLSKIPYLLTEAVSGCTLEELVMNHESDEEDIYRGLHVLLLSRVLLFDRAVIATNYEPQRKRLVKLNTQLGTQSLFERLGLSDKAKDSEIKRSYIELAKVLHPDKLAPDAPKDVKELTRSAFEKINEAYEKLSDEGTKTIYLKELQNGNADLVLRADQMIEDGRNCLTRGDVKKASDVFSEAARLAPPSTELKLLLMWTRLKFQGIESRTDELSKIRDQMASIPAEDRHTALFYFVRGLLFAANKDWANAIKSVEHSVSIENDFIEGRRELNVLRAHAKSSGSTDLLRGDLKDVVGMLFKKKK